MGLAADEEIFPPDNGASGEQGFTHGLQRIPLGKHEGNGAVSGVVFGLGPIIPVDEFVNIGYADQGQVVL